MTLVKKAYSPELKERLFSLFEEFSGPVLASYEEPTRAGTPKGDPIGLSRQKYYAAALQLLHGPYSVKELAEKAGVSHDVLRKWRTEVPFMIACNDLENEFALFVIRKLEECEETTEYRVLAKILLYRYDIWKKYLDNLWFKSLTEKDNIKGFCKLIKMLHLFGFKVGKLNQKADIFEIELARITLDFLFMKFIKHLPVTEDTRTIMPMLTEMFKVVFDE